MAMAEEENTQQQEDAPSSSPLPSASAPSQTKLFLGGLSWQTTEDKLREYFLAFGEVEDAVVMVDRVAGNPRGFGFIKFKEAEASEKAIKHGPHLLDNRLIDCKPSIPIGQQPTSSRRTKVFVGGLAASTTEADVREHFSKWGTVLEAQVLVDPVTQRSRGFGFITYEDEESVQRVFAAGPLHELAGKTVEVKAATPKGSGPQPPSQAPPAGYGQGSLGHLPSASGQLLQPTLHPYPFPTAAVGTSMPVAVARAQQHPHPMAPTLAMPMQQQQYAASPQLQRYASGSSSASAGGHGGAAGPAVLGSSMVSSSAPGSSMMAVAPGGVAARAQGGGGGGGRVQQGMGHMGSAGHGGYAAFAPYMQGMSPGAYPVAGYGYPVYSSPYGYAPAAHAIPYNPHASGPRPATVPSANTYQVQPHPGPHMAMVPAPFHPHHHQQGPAHYAPAQSLQPGSYPPASASSRPMFFGSPPGAFTNPGAYPGTPVHHMYHMGPSAPGTPSQPPARPLTFHTMTQQQQGVGGGSRHTGMMGRSGSGGSGSSGGGGGGGGRGMSAAAASAAAGMHTQAGRPHVQRQQAQQQEGPAPPGNQRQQQA